MNAGCACGRPVRDARLCGSCTRDLRRELTTAAGLAPDLDLATARQTRFARSPGASRSRGTALPYDTRASDAATALRDVLAGWIRAISPAGVQDTHTAVMALQLLRQVPAIRQRDDAARRLDDLTAAVIRCLRVIDRPPSRIYAGPCPDCGTDLLGKPGHLAVTCRGCGAGHSIAERQEWLRGELDGVLGSASWCATAATALGLPVAEATIRSWVHRRKLAARHHEPRRPGGAERPLYRLADVLDLALERAARR